MKPRHKHTHTYTLTHTHTKNQCSLTRLASSIRKRSSIHWSFYHGNEASRSRSIDSLSVVCRRRGDTVGIDFHCAPIYYLHPNEKNKKKKSNQLTDSKQRVREDTFRWNWIKSTRFWLSIVFFFLIQMNLTRYQSNTVISFNK